MTRRTLLIAAAAVVVLAGIAGWFRPMPVAVGPATAHQPKWQLPRAADLERSTAAQFAAIARVPWFGEAGEGAGGPGAQWTLLGVVGRPDDRAILVRAGSDPLIKRLHSGDTLPDGSKLVTVGSSGIVAERDGCRTIRPLYPPDRAAPPADAGDGACTPSGHP